MPAFLAMLGLFELERWGEQKKRRKELLHCLIEKFGHSSCSTYLPAVYNDSARDVVPLRFVFSYAGSDQLLQKLNKYIDVNWIWFRQPVTCAIEGLESLQYFGNSCPVSEEICSSIVNLPCNVVEGWEPWLLTGFDKALTQCSK
ncbi:MAG: hypothetical protein HY846_09750 [Nitrosomonadales bacterium]|nr:hypothetical protein [Nitrosomonadales bacterium]